MIISIDGACKCNGKPDCISAGGVFVKLEGGYTHYTRFERGSTNQRGELLALIEALRVIPLYFINGVQDVTLIADSEYLVNCINKEWYVNWENKGWITAAGEPVKNRDLWEQVVDLMAFIDQDRFVMYHIKGHVFPFGRVTARKIIQSDTSCETLYGEVWKKFEQVKATKTDKIQHAFDVFERNHGFKPPVESLEEMIVCNMVSDLIAGFHIDKLEASLSRR